MPSSTPDLDTSNEPNRQPGNNADEQASTLRDATLTDGREDDIDQVDIIGEIDNDTGDADKAPDRINDRHLR